MGNKVKEILYNQKDNVTKGIYVYHDDRGQEFVSYADLYQLALIKLGNLQQMGIQKGQEVILDFNDYIDYFSMLWAGFLGDYIIIPYKIQKEDLNGLNGIMNNCMNPIIFTEQKNICEQLQRKVVIVNAEALMHNNKTAVIEHEYQSNVIMVQFSSGSTSAPKGVMISDENIYTNIEDYLIARDMSKDDVFFAWTPMTHNMGLFLSHLFPTYIGANQIFLPTQIFVKDTKLWLEICTKNKVTVTATTNYGMVKLLQMMNSLDEIDELKKYDLSSFKQIIAGSDLIGVDTKELFLDKLSCCNVRRNVFAVGYGLTEATLGVTITEIEDDVFLYVNKSLLKIGEIVSVSKGDAMAMKLISLGKPHPHVEIRIVDLMNCPLEDSYLGVIKIRGKSITKGYYQDTDITKEVIDDEGWLDTGDIGFIKDGLLFITGRYKDLILFNGKNYFSNDIEELISRSNLTNYQVAVIGVREDNNINDTIVCFIESKFTDTQLLNVTELIRNEVLKVFNIIIDHIIQIDVLPRTTSNKINRYELKNHYRKKTTLIQSNNIDKNDYLIREVESFVIETFQDILGEKLSKNRKLCELSCTSMEVTVIYERLMRKYPFVTIADLYEAKYISDLVNKISFMLE